MVKSIVDYTLQLEVLAESDTFALADVNSAFNFTSTDPEWNDPGLNSTTGYKTAEKD